MKGTQVCSLFLLTLQSTLGTAAALQPTRCSSSAHGPCAFTSLPSTIAQNTLPSPLPLTSSSVRRKSIPSSFKQSALRATIFPSSGSSAEALFPSDDSDYELSAENGKHSNAVVVAKSKTTADSNNNEKDDDDNTISEIFNSIQSQINLGYDQFVFVDPIDTIANWVSDRFVEQSLQWKNSKDIELEANDVSNNSDDGSTISSSNENKNASSDKYIMESYSPGSALDAIAQASSTYTPLSYQIRTVVRTVLPSILIAIVATELYPSMVQWVAHLHTGGNDNAELYTDDVLTVLSNDLSQYVQNILTTCALLFGMLVGQTYYFMYQQQELVFYALFAEVTEAKSLLEQISLMTYGRPKVYNSLLSRMNDYVQNDLKLLSVKDPIALTARLPKDDPLESILYATSVGLPGVVYDTVKSLRQARASRCGALQRKLPALHIYCLRLLGVIVMAAFPICGSGSQAIAPNVLVLQSYLFGVLAFALTLVLNVVEELRNSRTKMGAYNVDGILEVMVGGLEQELEERLEGKFSGVGLSPSLPARGVFAGEGAFGVGSSGGGGVVWATKDDEMVTGFRGEVADVASIADKENDPAPSPSRRRRVKKWLKGLVLRE